MDQIRRFQQLRICGRPGDRPIVAGAGRVGDAETRRGTAIHPWKDSHGERSGGGVAALVEGRNLDRADRVQREAIARGNIINK